MMDRLEQAVMRELRAQLDEARAELAELKAQRRAWLDTDNAAAALVKQEKELMEARAELEVITRQCDRQILEAMRAVAERDALRAAVEAHNARCHNDMNAGELMPETWPTEYLIPLPPSAAHAAAAPAHKPTCAVFKGVGSMNYGEFVTPPCDCAAPEAGPKIEIASHPTVTDDGRIAWRARDLFFKDDPRAVVQQTTSLSTKENDDGNS